MYGFLIEGVISLDSRLGFIGIIVENRSAHASEVNSLLSQYAELIISRTGIPHTRRGCAVISLIVDATTDEIGELSGKLGSISGVSVKSMLSKTQKRQLTGGDNATSGNQH